MILSVDSVISFIIASLFISAFFVVTPSFDFSTREIAAVKFASVLALKLQKEKNALTLLYAGDRHTITELLPNEYCVEVEAGQNKVGKCTGQKVVKTVLIVGEEVFSANIGVYFS